MFNLLNLFEPNHPKPFQKTGNYSCQLEFKGIKAIIWLSKRYLICTLELHAIRSRRLSGQGG